MTSIPYTSRETDLELPGDGVRPGWRVPARTLAALAVGAAMATSSIVFSEPAIADVLMAAVLFWKPRGLFPAHG